MKATTVMASDLTKYGRMDAAFFVSLKNAEGPHGDAFHFSKIIESTMSQEDVLKNVREIREKAPGFVDEMIRPLARNKDEKDAYKRALQEYPSLALAMLLNRLDEVDEYLGGRVAEAKLKLSDLTSVKEGVADINVAVSGLLSQGTGKSTALKPKKR